MNNCTELLEQAESLKKELNNGRNGISSDGSGKGEWVSSRTMLQDVYRQVLISNLELALDKKIEQELWNLVFKNHITTLQQKVKDKSNTFRVEAQSQLTSFLDAASGFYTQLLDDLCQTFQINIPYRVRSSKLVFLKDSGSVKQNLIAQPERPSCQYMCQHCLVHLGDIARYRNQIGQAESYYRYAAQLVPSNGQPYNQLAILAAAGGDVLSTAFYYCRSLAVKCPFPGSDTNLRRQLTKIMAGDEPKHTKISTSELVKFCLKFHACIYLKKNESGLLGIVERLAGYIRAHLRAGSLSRQQITHMTFLNLFSLYHLAPNGVDASGLPVDTRAEVGDDKPSVKGDESEEKENISWSAMLTFTMHMLGGLLACVPAHSDDTADLEHPALPAIKLTLDWLASNTSTLKCAEVIQNSRVWPRLAKVLNALGNQDKANNMNNHHLPEDLEVRGFVGLKSSLSKLEFLGGIDSGVPATMEHACRCYRLYQLGISIAEANNDLLSFTDEDNGTVFNSSISPSPQHGAKTNGVEEKSEEEEEEDSEDDQELASSPVTSGGILHKEVHLYEPQAITGSALKRGNTRTKGVLKVPSDDPSSSIRKKNRVPRMQNVAVQIKPDQKLKVIKEEEGHNDSYLLSGEIESGGNSTESSQSDVSPSGGTHPRSGHRVTFAAAQHISPTQYSRDDTPSPVTSNYLDQNNMVIPGVQVYPEANSHIVQQQYLPNMHLVSHSQQMGPIYRHQPVSSPILTGPFARRGMAPYAFPHNMLARPHLQMNPFQHVQPPNPPPHPTELPKPVFQASLYNPTVNSDNFRASVANSQRNMPLRNSDGGMDHNRKMTRPTDISYFQHMHQNPMHNMSNLSPTNQDLSQNQRSGGPSMTMAAQFNTRPSMNMSVIQHLRMQEIAHNAEMTSDILNDGHRDVMNPSDLPFNNQNLYKPNFQKQGIDFSQLVGAQPQQQPMIRSQNSGFSNPSNMLSSRQLPTYEGDLRISTERNVFPGNYMPPSSNSVAGGSNNTSSTSSPTPGSLSQLNNLPNTTCSPQAGSINNGKFSGVSNVLGQGLSSMLMEHSRNDLDLQRRPNTLTGVQIQHGGVGFVGSPSQKLTPTALTGFMSNEQSNDSSFNMDASTHAVSSIFGLPQNLTEDQRSHVQQPTNHSTPVESYSLQQERVKAMFEESRNPKSQISKAALETLQARHPLVQMDKFQDPLISKEDKDSYKLFPVTDSSWGISRGNRGEGLGLTGLGTIGSERAAAQQNHRYSPWGGSSQMPGGSVSSTLSDKLEVQRGLEINSSRTEPEFASGLHSQSFWSTPMVPSGPSALEQLIRQQQQQHVTRDKSPP